MVGFLSFLAGLILDGDDDAQQMKSWPICRVRRLRRAKIKVANAAAGLILTINPAITD